MHLDKLRKFLLFYIIVLIAGVLSVQPVAEAAQRSRVNQRSRDAYARQNSYYRSRNRVPSQERAFSSNSYQRVQSYLQARDFNGLKEAVKNGLTLEDTNVQGDTAVCVAIKRRDYIGFSMLKSVGANLAPSCVKEIPVEEREAFIERYTELGGRLSSAAQEGILSISSSDVGAFITDSTTLAVAGTIVGVGAVVAIAAGGGGGGGGGGSGSSGNGDGSKPSGSSGYLPDTTTPDTPSTTDKTKPEYYTTKEFTSKNFKNGVNFLGQINAQYAYATAAENGQPVAGEGAIIAVIDEGTDTTHRELKNNILKDSSGNVVGKNFDYGPCMNGDKTNCWITGYYSDGKPITVLYGDTFGDVRIAGYIKESDLIVTWPQYYSKLPSDWDWDKHKNDPNPVSESQASHGTHVAGIAAAAKDDYGMHGVAYNAKIIPINAGIGWYAPNETYFEAFKYAADNGAQVLNNSWGAEDVVIYSDAITTAAQFNEVRGNNLKSAIEYATWSGDYTTSAHIASNPSIVVFAAGNSGNAGVHPQPTIENGAPTAIPSLLYYKEDGQLKRFSSFPSDTSSIVSSLFVTVVSVNSSNQLTWYTQRCGGAARWCIAAPGGYQTSSNSQYNGIISSVPGNKYDMKSGTSMAAPVVTGALATILAASPSLKPEEAVEIMFKTATDLGTAGVDEDFGWGLLNLQAALSPVGTTSLALGDTTTENQVSFSGTHLTMPRIFNYSLLEKLPENIVILDEYKRAFSIPTTSVIRTTSHSGQAFANNLRSFTKWQRPQTAKISDTFDMRFSENPKAFSDEKLNGITFAFNYHKDSINADFSFTQNAKEGMENYFNQSLLNPFTTSATDVYALQNSFSLNKKIKLGFGASVGKNNFFDGNERLDYRHESSVKTGHINLDYQPISFATIKLSSGILDEDGSLLGFNGFGGLKTGDSQTYFMGSQLSVEPIKKVRLSAAYYYGSSKMKNESNSLMRLSNVQSESMALKAEYQFDENILLGAKGGSPLHVRKGRAFFDLPVGRDATENKIYRERVTASLKPQAKEWDWGLFGVYNIDAWTFQTEAMTRLHPDNQSNTKPDYRLMFSVGFGY